MAKKKRRSRGGLNTQSLFKIARWASLALPAVAVATTPVSNYEKAVAITQAYTGYNMKTRDFKLERLAQGWLPYLATSAVTYGIPKLTGLLRRV